LPPSAPEQSAFVEEPEEEPVVEEAKPAKRQAKKAEPKPENSKLADVLSTWGDEG